MSKAFTEILIREAIKKNRSNIVKKTIKTVPVTIKEKIEVDKPAWQKEKSERLKRNSWIN